jgi:hypothetical protein
VIAYAARKHVAPQREHVSVWLRHQRDPAAFAAVVGRLEIAAKARAAIVRHRVVDRRAGIVGRLAAGGDEIALVDPTRPARDHRG